ncbi:MAG: hypothetical protein PVF28_03580 [Thioalkalispiraceae bacterium]|jgi:hypothetical protein
MEGISDIKIIGVDKKRPPLIRNEPYIDLFFELSHQAPADWCRGFNELLEHHPSKPKILEKEGKYIEGWVRTPEEIVDFVELLKQTVTECSRQYIDRIELSARQASDASGSVEEASGEQGRLNRIISSLVFDKID